MWTDETWKCTPKDDTLPANWMEEGFDDSHWPFAVSRGQNGVWPWDDHVSEIGPDAHWIWTNSSQEDMSVVCRKYIGRK